MEAGDTERRREAEERSTNPAAEFGKLAGLSEFIY
jgi:hypothetical protein